ncbi:hypothetical protein [Propionicimonas sp.]|uniref:hypothetical protein n=1 Tax=Propionicimonas sp. TaxID=1955623 RepID=UPI0039E5561B
MSFYGWLWRVLPGPVPAKVVQAALLAVAVVAVLFGWVFPQVAPFMPFNNTTVGP